MSHIPAFPNHPDTSPNTESYNGMYLLDYMAAKIAVGYIASMNPGPLSDELMKEIAETSYRGASFMIKERIKYLP